MPWTNLLHQAGRIISNNSPNLLSGIAVTTSVATAFLAGKASFAASAEIRHEALTRELTQVEPEPLTTKDKIMMVWPHYIPAAVTGTTTIVCIIAANRIGNRRAAAMAAAYAMSREAFAEYKEKVVEKLGESKEQKLRDEIVQDQVDRNPVRNNEVYITNNGEVMCYDTITGRYFKSNVESLRKAENDINRQIIHDMYASATDFYSLIGLPSTPYSNEVGWNHEYPFELKFSTVLSEDNIPCIAINYEMFPMRGYDVIF